MDILVNIVCLLLVIGILTFIHELGHFLAAKLVGAKVLEFSLGFGPQLLHKEYKGTMYSLRILPFGGYVKILGDGDPSSEEEKIDINSEDSLKKKSKISQMFVMLAGITMNVFLAILLYTVYLGFNSWKYWTPFDVNPVGAEISSEISYELASEGGAKDSGMYERGVIKNIDNKDINSVEDITNIFLSNKGNTVKVYACEYTEKECSTFDIKLSDEGKAGMYLGNFVLDYSQNKVFSGASHLVNMVKLITSIFSILFQDAKQTGDYSALSDSVSGPVGIYFATGFYISQGIVAFIGFVADLSLSLAIMNILPIPALDGGRFIIIFIESILRKDLDSRVENLIINISFILLILLIFLVMIKDILNINELKDLLGQ